MADVNAYTWGALAGHTWGELGTWGDLLNLDVPEDPPADPDFGTPTWYICDILTGKILFTLPEVKCETSDVLGQYTSSTATVPIPTDTLSPVYLSKGQIRDLFWPWRRMLVRVGAGLPMWAGVITGRERGSSSELSFPVSTLGVYLDMRIVGDHDFVNADESTIYSALLADANVEGINIFVDAPPTGVRHDRSYRRKDGVTVFKRLDELSDVENGSEWHIFLRWMPDESGFLIVLELRPEIGVQPDLPPVKIKARPSSGSDSAMDATYKLIESYSREDFANHITAVGDGQGEAQPESVPARSAALDSGQEPRIERRFNPSSGITDIETLNAHARAALARDEAGSETWEVTVSANATPIYGKDFTLGRHIKAELTGPGHPPDPDDPTKPGVTVIKRVMGWSLNQDGSTMTFQW